MKEHMAVSAKPLVRIIAIRGAMAEMLRRASEPDGSVGLAAMQAATARPAILIFAVNK